MMYPLYLLFKVNLHWQRTGSFILVHPTVPLLSSVLSTILYLTSMRLIPHRSAIMPPPPLTLQAHTRVK